MPGHETELIIRVAPKKKRFAVVGAGPAGLAAATTLAERGHEVHLFEAASMIGGQFNMAKRVPGKEEFVETLRYFRQRIDDTGVKLSLDTRVRGRRPARLRRGGARHRRAAARPARSPAATAPTC